MCKRVVVNRLCVVLRIVVFDACCRRLFMVKRHRRTEAAYVEAENRAGSTSRGAIHGTGMPEWMMQIGESRGDFVLKCVGYLAGWSKCVNFVE